MKKNLQIGIGFAFCTLFCASCEKEFIEKQLLVETPRGNQRVVAGEYIVEFVDNGSLGTDAKLTALAEEIADRPDSNPLLISQYYQCVYKGVAVRLSSTEAETFAQDPRVVDVEQVHYLDVPVIDNSTQSSINQFVNWGLTRVGWTQNTPSGVGKRAWVIDSGVQHDHPDLTVAAASNTGGSKTFHSGTANPWDQFGHGTQMAGLIAAKNNTYGVVGVAPGATVVSLRIMNANGDGTTSMATAAVDYVCRYGVAGEVVNLSFGEDSVDLSVPEKKLEKAIRIIANSGLLVSISAGNSAVNVNTFSPARMNRPGVYTITAMKEDSETTTPLIPDYWMNISNFGDASIVDYCAPGKNVRSTKINNAYGAANGTSAAAAIMSGILLQKGTGFSTDSTVNNDPMAPADPIVHL